MKKIFIFFILGIMTSVVIAGPEFDPELHDKLAKSKEQRIRKSLRQLQEAHTVDTENVIDVVHYGLDLDFDVENKVLYGSVNVTASVNGESVSTMILDMWGGLVVDSIFVPETGQLLNFIKKTSRDWLMITLDREYKNGESINYCVVYHGRPQDSGYGAFDFSANGTMIWSLSEPYGARSWWPCKDNPSDKADSVDIRLTVPNNMTAVSNGTLRSKETNGEKTTWWWHEQYPITTYLVSVAIHEYEIHYDQYIYNDGADTMQIEFYNYPGNYKLQQKDSDKVKHMIRFLSDIYGQYPFIEEKYGHADFAGGGAMEHQTCSSFSFWGEGVFLHELAHQWCGDLITCDSWEHIWINEGFATYSEALWYDHAYPNITASDYQMGTNIYLGDGTVYVEDPLNEVIFDGGLSYNKGSWVLHMLRHVVGDSTFFKIMKSFFSESQYRFNSVTTEEFRDFCEQFTDIDLDTFFHQWIYEEGYPVYHLTWDWEPVANGKYKVYGTIKQKQTMGPVFDMPVDLNIALANGDTLFQIQNYEKEQRFEFNVNDVPLDLFVDKDNWILKKVEYNSNPEFTIDHINISESVGNVNGIIDAGEQINMQIHVLNTGHRLNSVKLTLLTNDEFLSLGPNSWQISNWEANEILGNLSSKIKLTVSKDVYPHLADFSLKIETSSGYTDVIDFNYPIGISRLLFVNDNNSPAVKNYFTSLFRKFNVQYSIWDTSFQGTPDITDWPIVVWSTGDAVDSTITREEQHLIIQYLENGGRLLINGQYIGYDLVENGTPEDSLFFVKYLHSEYTGRESAFRYLYGEKNTLFGDSILLSLFSDESNLKLDSFPEIIVPESPEVQLFKYNNTYNSSGIYYFDDINNSKLIYLSFGIESVSTVFNPGSVYQFFNGILMWFMDVEHPITDVSELKVIPEHYELRENFPNPFNPETVIRFSVPNSEWISLDIFDIRGRKVNTLYNRFANPGDYSVVWNGKDSNGNQVPSGTYFYRLKSASFQQTKKLLLLR